MARIGWAALLAGCLVTTAAADEVCYPNNPSYPPAGQTCYNNGSSTGPSGGAYTVPPNVHCSYLDILTLACMGKSSAGWQRLRAERDEVKQLVIAGRCDDAIKRALEENDWTMARDVKAVCSPTP